jgi:hypothetical protein
MKRKESKNKNKLKENEGTEPNTKGRKESENRKQQKGEKKWRVTIILLILYRLVKMICDLTTLRSQIIYFRVVK